ncbi:hypothetical protein PF003_g10716 [Phytophthora fragariae]|nr:hypothetical protein PF003_g10716 [Phytophthora fragariae]
MFLSFRPSWCTRSTFLLQICVMSTATPCCHKSVATSLTSLQGSKFPVLPHSTSHLGSMRSVKLKMSGSAVSRSWSVHLCPRWASPILAASWSIVAPPPDIATLDVWFQW